MKHLIRLVQAGLLVAGLAGAQSTAQHSANPAHRGGDATRHGASASTAGPGSGNGGNSTTGDDRDRSHNFGWIGLLGLAGLSGLMRRDRHNPNNISR